MAGLWLLQIFIRMLNSVDDESSWFVLSSIFPISGSDYFHVYIAPQYSLILLVNNHPYEYVIKQTGIVGLVTVINFNNFSFRVSLRDPVFQAVFQWSELR